MVQVQEIKVINIDNVPYAVDAMSETAQRLVTVYNDWNQNEADIRDKLMMVQAAKETLSRQIIEQVRTEKAEAEAKLAEESAESTGVVLDSAITADPAVETATEVAPAEETVTAPVVEEPVIAGTVEPTAETTTAQ